MEIRYVASGQRCQIYVSYVTFAHLWQLTKFNSPFFFSDDWELSCFALNSHFNFYLNSVCWLRFYYMPNPNAPRKPFWPKAKGKPPATARFASGPAGPTGAQTQCSPLVYTSIL